MAANFLANTVEGQAATRVLVAPRLEYIDQMLDGRRFLTGESFAAPDTYLFVMRTWALHIDLAPWARLADYFTRIAARPAARAARQVEGPPHALKP